MTEDETQLQLFEDTQAELTVTDEDTEDVGPLAFLTYEDTNDKKILRSVREVFHGFDFDPTGNVGKLFENAEALSSYMTATMDDIDAYDQNARAHGVTTAAACAARFWYLCNYMHRALCEGSYGKAAYSKLAAYIGKSIPYIYQLRAAGSRLTAADCYLLGMRSVSRTMILKIATIQDDQMRNAIIKAFIDQVEDSSSMEHLVKARSSLAAAVRNQLEGKPLNLETSDPTAGGTETQVTPEYDAAITQIKSWERMLKKPSTEETAELLCATLDDFFIMETTPNAAEHAQEIKDAAMALKNRIAEVKANLTDIESSIDSLVGVAVLKKED